MTIIIFTLLLFEILSFLTLKNHFSKYSRSLYYCILILHFALSLPIWYYLIKVITFKGFADNPELINDQLTLTGFISAVAIPRSIASFIHFTGKLLRKKKGGHIRWLTEAGLILTSLIFLIIVYSSFFSRYNFQTEKIAIRIKDLGKSLDGLKIIHLSDMHLSSFYKHPDLIDEVLKEAISHDPDLMINTGDFVTIGRREFSGFVKILSKYKARYGNYAILGNHDMGTYLPSEAEEKKMTPMLISELVSASGYRVLRDENEIIEINGKKVAIIGVITEGSHPGIIHGDVIKASAGTDSADLKILLIHDPNQWDADVKGKTDIQLSLAGHTHGMQIGIITRNFRWSPAKYFYPRWNGLYSAGNQHLYVNRGLGILGIPFRIWMPPEITVITLLAE